MAEFFTCATISFFGTVVLLFQTKSAFRLILLLFLNCVCCHICCVTTATANITPMSFLVFKLFLLLGGWVDPFYYVTRDGIYKTRLHYT
jgi:hypothetical protein